MGFWEGGMGSLDRLPTPFPAVHVPSTWARPRSAPQSLRVAASRVGRRGHWHSDTQFPSPSQASATTTTTALILAALDALDRCSGVWFEAGIFFGRLIQVRDAPGCADLLEDFADRSVDAHVLWHEAFEDRVLSLGTGRDDVRLDGVRLDEVAGAGF